MVCSCCRPLRAVPVRRHEGLQPRKLRRRGQQRLQDGRLRGVEQRQRGVDPGGGGGAEAGAGGVAELKDVPAVAAEGKEELVKHLLSSISVL